MEKGFNDDELADIMNEIESLEQDFADDPHSHEEEAEDHVEQIEAKVEVEDKPKEELETIKPIDDVVEPESSHAEQNTVAAKHEPQEVLDDLSQMPLEKSVPNHVEDEKVHQFKKPQMSSSSGQNTSMNFYVEGDMSIDLGFNVGGQHVSIAVSNNEGLVITLDSGVKFTVPLESAASNRQAS